jgi:hypothetical protein
LLVGAALEHFFLVLGDVGFDRLWRGGLFLRCGSAVGLMFGLRLGALGFSRWLRTSWWTTSRAPKAGE